MASNDTTHGRIFIVTLIMFPYKKEGDEITLGAPISSTPLFYDTFDGADITFDELKRIHEASGYQSTTIKNTMDSKSIRLINPDVSVLPAIVINLTKYPTNLSMSEIAGEMERLYGDSDARTEMKIDPSVNKESEEKISEYLANKEAGIASFDKFKLKKLQKK